MRIYISILCKKTLLIHPLRKANLLNIRSTEPTLAVFRLPLLYCYLMILFLSDDVIVVLQLNVIYLFIFLYLLWLLLFLIYLKLINLQIMYDINAIKIARG